MRLQLIPLDERPVNTRYPRMIAALAGAEVVLPPSAVLPDRKHPADRAALLAWIKTAALRCDACVLCVETLAYGGLIASRTSGEPAWEVLNWLKEALQYLPRPVYVSNVIMRINRYDDSGEEPDYWATYGSRLHAYSMAAVIDPTRAAQIAETVPINLLHDFLRRRARNHTVNMALLAGAESFDLLVLPSDDTAPDGLQTQERAALIGLRTRLGFADRVLLYSGADEIGCTLTARLLNQGKPAPRIFVDYAVPGGDQIIAKYEDRPVAETIAGQAAAVGAVLIDDPMQADVYLLVNPPSVTGLEWPEVDPNQEQAIRGAWQSAGIVRAAGSLRNGRRVAVADVAYPNGADPGFVVMLMDGLPIADLAGYGAWNTAGNTIGSVLAAACLPVTDNAARRRFLAHRFLEDWGYQQDVRTAMIGLYGAGSPDRISDYEREIDERLQTPLAVLRDHGLAYALTDVCLPWRRFFEVDFELVEIAS